MPYKFEFSSNVPYRYADGALFLGRDPEHFYDVGIQTERHALTIAGAGSGKGAALMIPNLQRWPHNALVIDPKGEAAEHTAEIREGMGQSVYVLDPFNVADVPERFKAKLNPLRSIHRDALDAREDIGVIADGLVMRHDPRASHWDGGGLSVIAGVIAYILDQAQDELRTLPELRRVLTSPPNDFARVVQEMSTNGAYGNLPATAASKLTKSGSEAGHFLSVADENTKWLDSPAISAVLSDSTFDLSDLKTKPCTVYLVLPAHLLGEAAHGRFLRLFVRMALNAMAKGGTKGGRRCLFMLDEFYSLGYIDEIAKAAGLMRGYGVSLWPILQDLGQLESLYGRDGMHTFFGNSDAHIFFGSTDAMTLDYISQRIGRITSEDIGAVPPTSVAADLPADLRLAANTPLQAPRPTPNIPHKKLGGMTSAIGLGVDAARGAMHSAAVENQAAQRQAIEDAERELSIADTNAMRDYQHAMSERGEPRLSADELKTLIAKKKGGKVAASMVVFTGEGDVLNLALAPYFEPAPSSSEPPTYKLPPEVRKARDNWRILEKGVADLKAAQALDERNYAIVWIIGVALMVPAFFLLGIKSWPGQLLAIAAAAMILVKYALHQGSKTRIQGYFVQIERKMREEKAVLEPHIKKHGPIPDDA